MIEEIKYQGVEDTFRQEKSYPTIKQTWGIVGLFILVTILYAVPLGVISIVYPDINHGPFLLANYCIPLIITIWIVQKWGKTNPQNQDKIKILSFLPNLLPMVGIAFLAMLNLNIEITSWLPMPDWMEQLLSSMMEKNIWGFLTVAVAAPIIEEYLLRGIVLDGMLKNYTPAKAILWSAFFFGFIHFNPWQFIVGFLAGLILGYLYWRTKSLLLCMLIHAFNNGISFYFSIKYPDFNSLAELFHFGVFQRITIVLMGIFVLYLCYRKFENYFKKNKLTNEE